MSLPATLPQATVDAILNRLAPFYLAAAGDDMAVARDAVRQLLSDYNPETVRELNLAAETITLQMHALDALCYAATPDLSDNKVLRLRGGAVSLSREQHKAQRQLDQIQKARRAGIQLTASEPAPVSPRIEKAIAIVQAHRPAEPAKAPANPPVKAPASLPSPQSFDKLEAAQRFGEILQRKQAEYAARFGAIAASAQPAAPNAFAATP